jgi:anti-sigma factor RsiW
VKHPSELDLAAYSSSDLGGATGFLRRLLVERHLHTCQHCRDEIAAYRELRTGLAEAEMPALDWDALASEMRANIHLGLEAGACVRVAPEKRAFSPRLAVAFASLLLLAGSGFFLRNYKPRAEVATAPAPEYRTPVLESSISGIELRTGRTSFALLNHDGAAASETVSAQGAVRSSDIDDTGSVTIKDVYLQ